MLELRKLLRNPAEVGFVQGHYYLTGDQISQAARALDAGDVELIREYERQMAALIGPGYGVSFAAGRMAFYALLKAWEIRPGDEVILPGFTCSVMPNAVWRAGATPVFADIDPETFGSCAHEINKKITRRTRVIVAQHSFGIPCDIEAIVELGRHLGLPVVEDCAISLDSSFRGVTVGNWGDAAIFSTDHSKPLNTIIGGLCYTKDSQLHEKIARMGENLPQLSRDHQDRLWKQFQFERRCAKPDAFRQRKLYNHLQTLLMRSKLRGDAAVFLDGDYNRPKVSPERYPYPAQMPPFLAQLGLFELARWETEKLRRKDLLGDYLQLAREARLGRYLPLAYQDPERDIVPLRFVFSHPGRADLDRRMEHLIDISWTWFLEPVICCDAGPESLGYDYGSCPIAESRGDQIVNWPCVVPEEWHSRLLSFFKEVFGK
jgi:perosamine synthetase